MNSYFSSGYAPAPRKLTNIVNGDRSEGSQFKLSDIRDAFVTYSFEFTGASSNPGVAIEISPDGVNWTEVAREEGAPEDSVSLSFFVPKTYFVRFTELTATISLISGQEVLL